MSSVSTPHTLEHVSAILNANSHQLSRTRKGVSDTSTSTLKQPLRLNGQALRDRSAENELRVHAFIFETRRAEPPPSAAAVREFLFQVADMTNDGLLPGGRLREWNIGSGPQQKLPPGELEAAIGTFCHGIFDRWGELETDPVPLAAWAEWELNGGALHPFYDGCGRISRSFAASLLLRGGTLPPLYETLADYFDHGNRGIKSFTTYVRAGITRSTEWIARSGEGKA